MLKLEKRYLNLTHLLYIINLKTQLLFYKRLKKTENYSLYIYPNKLIKIPEEKVSTAPGNVKEKVAQWKDDNKFIIIKNNVGYIIPKSHKKMSDLKLLKSDDYKKFRKKNKLNLKKRESLIKFVDYLNS